MSYTRTVTCLYNGGKTGHRVDITRDNDGFVTATVSACGVERGLNGPGKFYLAQNWAGKMCSRCYR